MKGYPTALLAIVGTALVASGLAPYDRTTWWLEVFPVLVGAPIVVATAQRFPLTSLVYTLLAGHAVILCVGGHYTYAQVPLGFWAGRARACAQPLRPPGSLRAGLRAGAARGRDPAARTPLRRGAWLFFLVTATCLAISTTYEWIEWWAALWGGHAADAFLGTQGDVWDTQWDMFLALIGALTAQTVLGRAHDRALAHLS